MSEDQLHGFYTGEKQCRGFYSDRCKHQKTVKDVHEGTLVCVDCAKVLDLCYISDMISDMKYESIIIDPYILYTPIEQYLTDICINGNIPKCIRNDSLDYFKSVKHNLEMNKFKVKDVDIMIYALYKILARHNTPRTPQEMQSLTNVSVGKLWNIETKITCQPTHTDPADYVNRYAIFLELKFKDILCVINIVNNVSGLDDVRPRCLVAGIFYLYCKQNNKKKPLKTICEICNVSTSAAHNVIKKIKCSNNMNILMCTYLSK